MKTHLALLCGINVSGCNMIKAEFTLNTLLAVTIKKISVEFDIIPKLGIFVF
jgi:hypothetical protein